MGGPFTAGQLHAGEHCPERGIFRATRINAERNRLSGMGQVADTHLMPVRAVRRVFNAKVGFPAAQAKPHERDRTANVGGGPVRIAAVRHHRAQPLHERVLVFHGGFQPVLAVKVYRNAALVEPPLACKFRPDRERKILLVALHLQDRCAVIAEAIISPLPQVGMGLRDDFYPVRGDDARFGLPRPAQGLRLPYSIHV